MGQEVKAAAAQEIEPKKKPRENKSTSLDTLHKDCQSDEQVHTYNNMMCMTTIFIPVWVHLKFEALKTKASPLRFGERCLFSANAPMKRCNEPTYLRAKGQI